MGQLAIYLPPFSSDYAGVCSALFDFNSLIAINDGHCCTQNYVGYDEPRWDKAAKTTLCTELRTIDAVFGNDALVVKKVTEAAETLQPDFIAVLGSPVPAIIGMDMPGIALEIEAQCDRPTFGFDTTGFNYYDKGMAAAGLALFKRYAADTGRKVANGVNILGMTPLDYACADNGATLRGLLQQGGFEVLGSFFMGATLTQVRRSGEAAVNLAVSAGGLALAKYLQRRFGTPYVAATPMGPRHGVNVLERLRLAIEGKENTALADRAGEPVAEAMLIVGDQIVAGSLREALRLAGCTGQIDAAGFFSMAPELRAPGDIWLGCEKDLVKLLRGGVYGTVIGDPLLARIPGLENIKHIALPHPAVSSRLFWHDVPVFAGEAFEAFVSNIAGGL